jgi:hypothetical protein
MAAHRSARQLIKEAEIDRDGFEWRIANGLDPCFAVYARAQAMVSITAEHQSTTKAARQFARIVSKAEDSYMPSYPPLSPVTTSHFAMWSLFDVRFRQSRETIGTCFLRIAELTEMPVELRTTGPQRPRVIGRGLNRRLPLPAEMSLPSGNNGRVDDDAFIANQGEMLVSGPRVYQAAG